MTPDSVSWNVTLWSKICPVVTAKSLDSSVNHKVQVELNSHADTSVLGFNIPVVQNHECCVDMSLVMTVNLDIKLLLLWMLL